MWIEIVLSAVFVGQLSVILFLAFRLAESAQEEARRTAAFMEKTLVAMQARHASEAADALSVLATNQESVRQHKRTHDVEMAAYERQLKETKKSEPKSAVSDKLIIKDLETGHDIEIQA